MATPLFSHGNLNDPGAMQAKTLDELISKQINNPNTEIGEWANMARKAEWGVSDEDIVQFIRKVHGFRIFCAGGGKEGDWWLYSDPVIDHFNKLWAQVPEGLQGAFADVAKHEITFHCQSHFPFPDPDIRIVIEHILRYCGRDPISREKLDKIFKDSDFRTSYLSIDNALCRQGFVDYETSEDGSPKRIWRARKYPAMVRLIALLGENGFFKPKYTKTPICGKVKAWFLDVYNSPNATRAFEPKHIKDQSRYSGDIESIVESNTPCG